MASGDRTRRSLAAIDLMIDRALGELDAYGVAGQEEERGQSQQPASVSFFALAAAGTGTTERPTRVTRDRSISLALSAVPDGTKIELTCRGHAAVKQWGGQTAILWFKASDIAVELEFQPNGSASSLTDIGIDTLMSGDVELVRRITTKLR